MDRLCGCDFRVRCWDQPSNCAGCTPKTCLVRLRGGRLFGRGHFAAVRPEASSIQAIYSTALPVHRKGRRISASHVLSTFKRLRLMPGPRLLKYSKQFNRFYFYQFYLPSLPLNHSAITLCYKRMLKHGTSRPARMAASCRGVAQKIRRRQVVLLPSHT